MLNYSEQPLITKKNHKNAFSVERDYVNSKAYHDKFELLPLNKDVQEAVYKAAGRLLEFVDGQEEERMMALNARTGDFLVDNFNRPGSIKGTSFTDEEYENIRKCPDSVVVIHSHSLNGIPFAMDISTYLKDDKIRISIVVCHDGTVYAILKVDECFDDLYSDFLERAKARTADLDMAKRMATTKIYQFNDKLTNKRKVFDVRRL